MWILLLMAALAAGETGQLWLRRRALVIANQGEADDASDEA